MEARIFRPMFYSEHDVELALTLSLLAHALANAATTFGLGESLPWEMVEPWEVINVA